VVKLRPLTEAQCYARCYGETGRGDTVRVIHAERRPRGGASVSGESLRRAFEERLDAREPEAA
jgi:hypothetical protein